MSSFPEIKIWSPRFRKLRNAEQSAVSIAVIIQLSPKDSTLWKHGLVDSAGPKLESWRTPLLTITYWLNIWKLPFLDLQNNIFCFNPSYIM